MVVWHRKRAFRLLSVLKLLELVKQKPLVWEGVRPLPPLTIRRVENGFTAHLGISVHHAKSKALLRRLEAAHPDIVTLMEEDAADFAQCEKVAVVLADMCFQSSEYAQHVESAIQYRTENNLVLLHVSPAVGGVPFSTIMQQCPANLKDMGIFNTLASELVDDDADYLAIVLQEIAERFALQSEASKGESHLATAADVEIELAAIQQAESNAHEETLQTNSYWLGQLSAMYHQSAADQEDAAKSEASEDKIAVNLRGQQHTESALHVETPRTAVPRSSCCEITTGTSDPHPMPSMGNRSADNQAALTVLQQLARSE